jgi:antitoxin MazE
VSAEDHNVLVRAIREPKLSLAQKLAKFDPKRHGGEAMATARVGHEVF